MYKHETIKLLEENTGEKLTDIGLGNDFLDMIPKAEAKKPKIDKRDYNNLKNFCALKDTNRASPVAEWLSSCTPLW